MTQTFPWINRRVADEIYKDILSQQQEEKKGVTVYLVKAPAGAGKTFLARDIGTRLGSADGYEPGEKDGILWSGILDLYDPDTNSNRGIERLLIRAFSQHEEVDFKEYYEERKIYVKLTTGGTGGPPLEEQRRIVERTFSSEIRKIARENHLVWAFDTIERLQSALDPTEAELGEIGDIEDTASVTGWLLDQITRLPKATILLFGRPADRFETRLKTAIEEANFNRDRTSGNIKFEVKDLSILSKEEAYDLFQFRQAGYPNLKKILTEEIKTLLIECTESNPLLLDIALQAILATGKFDVIRKALDKKGDMTEAGKILLKIYMDHSSSERRTVLSHLALARNGLSPNLLEALEPGSFIQLEKELLEIAKLPFVKTRHLFTKSSEVEKQTPHLTFFLHDAMYAICDMALLKPVQAKEDCKIIVNWYQQKIDESRMGIPVEEGRPENIEQIERRDDPISDLLVESLFYRLRSDPLDGYIWYLAQAESAFRMVKTGFEMRLRDAMAQFAINADPNGKNDSASSEIDRANIKTIMPDLWQQFQIDSAMMWVRRLSFRGRHQDAVRVADKATWAKEIYLKDKTRYCLSYAELGIWKAQSLMYMGKIQKAIEVYKENLNLLERFDLKTLATDKETYGEFKLKRICFIKGRTHNNLGYTYWMYLGKNKAALIELSRAMEYFKLGKLSEEEATTLDNMGRIHAVLWHQPPAQLRIEEGLKKREDEKSKYRVALSHISLASIQHRFGNPHLALENVNKAYETFKNMAVERGIGLAYLTRAMIQRSVAEAGRENGLSLEKSMETTQSAISDLTNALRIFKDSVQETIRYVYALNEMGSCYRCLYLLRALGNASEESKLPALKEGIYYYTEAIKHAEKHGYFIEKLDSKQDLAVLYFRAQDHGKAMLELNQILAEIPTDYKLLPDTEPKVIPEAEVTDAYFKLMGQVELLIGAIIFDQQMKSQINLQTSLEALEHYLLSVAYYYRYSTVSSNTYVKATERIYKRLSRCDKDMLEKLEQHVDKLIIKYRIPAEWAKPLFNQIFVMLGVYPDK